MENPCIECGGNYCWHEDCECRKVIPLSVIEDIKAEIEKTVCEELNYCDVELSFLKWCAGLKYSLKIIDKHIEDIGGK